MLECFLDLQYWKVETLVIGEATFQLSNITTFQQFS